jgi:ABC-2 type transport system permease protein
VIASLLRVLALVRKEILAVLKDARTRNMLLLQPVLQCLLFGYAATLDLNNVPYAVLDRDRSAASSALLAKLDGSGVFHRIANLTDPADMRRLIDNQKVLVVIQIEPDFQRRLSEGEAAPVQVIADGRNSNTAGSALGDIGAAVQSFNADWASDHGLPPPPVQVDPRAWYNANLETRWNLIPALIGTITMMSTMMLAALSVAREREEGTFDQLLVTPFTPVEIMAGKAIPAMLIGVVQATNALLVAQFWFRIPSPETSSPSTSGSSCSCWRRSGSASSSPRSRRPCSRRCSMRSWRSCPSRCSPVSPPRSAACRHSSRTSP